MSNKFLGDYEFTWGPVRKGVSESILFEFLTSGEELHALNITSGYKSRGYRNALLNSGGLYGQILVTERISGLHSFASSLSFCIAVENFFGLDKEIHENIIFLRMFFAEFERIRNHIENLAETTESTYIQVPSALYSYHAESLKQLSLKYLKSRYLMGLNTVGGIRKDLSMNQLEAIFKSIKQTVDATQRIIKKNLETKSHIDRLKTTGKIGFKAAKKFHANGVVAKSAGINRDLRIKIPYLFYDHLKLKPVLLSEGDAFSRYSVRISEIAQSLEIMDYCIEMLKKNEFESAFKYNAGRNHESFAVSGFRTHAGFGFAESSEGQIFCLVNDFDGNIFKKINLRYPFYNNYRLFAESVKDTMMMDFNINETSYNFSVAALDK